MTDNLKTEMSKDHLVVLVHGLWGSVSHLEYVKESIEKEFGDKAYLLVTKTNEGNNTYDGIETGGERVTLEIENYVEELKQNGKTVNKISVIGYSLGGLIARYAIGVMDSKGLFDKLEPMNFVTFASPHLGVRSPWQGLRSRLFNRLGSRMLSQSGRQLFLMDTFRDTGRPLLSVLADTDSIFIYALKKFKRRSLYSNIINDRSAVHYTTMISKTDPYLELDKLDINYLRGYEDVIVDTEHPFSRKPNNKISFYDRIATGGRNAIGNVPITFFFLTILPIATVVFSVNSGIQSFRSQQRIRMHQNSKAGLYRFPIMAAESVRRTAEQMIENVNSMHEPEYADALPPHKPSETQPLSAEPKSTPSRLSADDLSDLEDGSFDKQTGLSFPTLALAPEQFAMIDALDNVGWEKHPVHIQKVRHSHAAIIVRTKWRDMSEGKVVVRHFTDNFVI